MELSVQTASYRFCSFCYLVLYFNNKNTDIHKDETKINLFIFYIFQIIAYCTTTRRMDQTQAIKSLRQLPKKQHNE